MSEHFNISPAENLGRATVIRVEGRLDAAAANVLRERCATLRAEGAQHLALDLSAISFVASSGVGVLLALTEDFGKAGGSLFLAPISAAVQSVIRLLNLEQFLAIYASLDDALALVH